jgi:hypothetical protein
MNKVDDTDSSVCPLCQGANRCAAATKASGEQSSIKHCWCFRVQFPANIIDDIPQSAKRKACICAQCVDKLALAKPA